MPLRIGICFHSSFSPDGDRLCVVGKVIKLWDLSRRVTLWEVKLQPHPCFCAFSPDGNRVAVKHTNGQIYVLDAFSGSVICKAKQCYGEGSNLMFTADSGEIIDGSWEGTISQRSALSGEESGCIQLDNLSVSRVLAPMDMRFLLTEQSPIQMKGETRKRNDYFCKWRLPIDGTSFSERLFDQHLFVEYSSLSPSGDFLLVFPRDPGGEDKLHSVLYNYNLSSMSQTWAQRVDKSEAISCLDWSPDGNLISIMTTSKVAILRAHDASTILELPVKYPSSVKFSPDGRLLAVGSWRDGYVQEIDGYM